MFFFHCFHFNTNFRYVNASEPDFIFSHPGVMSLRHALRCVHQEELSLENTESGLAGSISETRHGGGSVMVWAAIPWCYVGPITTLHAREYVDMLGNRVNPMIPGIVSDTAVSQDDTTMPPPPPNSHRCNRSFTV
jgi:hypothetical protein